MGDPLYAAEKLELAVYELATGIGTAKDRVYAAALVFWPVQPGDLPASLRADYAAIRRDLTKREPRAKEGRILATLWRMQNRTAAKIAQRIYELRDKLHDSIEQGQCS